MCCGRKVRLEEAPIGKSYTALAGALVAVVASCLFWAAAFGPWYTSPAPLNFGYTLNGSFATPQEVAGFSFIIIAAILSALTAVHVGMSLVVGECCRGPRSLAFHYSLAAALASIIGVSCAATAADVQFKASQALGLPVVWGAAYGVAIAGVIAISAAWGLFALDCFYICCCGVTLEASAHARAPKVKTPKAPKVPTPAPASVEVAGGAKAVSSGKGVAVVQAGLETA